MGALFLGGRESTGKSATPNGGFQKRGVLQSWMVYNGNTTKIWMMTGGRQTPNERFAVIFMMCGYQRASRLFNGKTEQKQKVVSSVSC